MTFAIDAVNLLNRANFTAANNMRYAVTASTLRPNPLFGQFTDQNIPRVIHLSVRIGI